jgi:hypothetical protein
VCSSHGQVDKERDGADFASREKVREAMRFHHQAFYNPGSIRLNVGRLRRFPPAASEPRNKDWTTVGQSYGEDGRLIVTCHQNNPDAFFLQFRDGFNAVSPPLYLMSL